MNASASARRTRGISLAPIVLADDRPDRAGQREDHAERERNDAIDDGRRPATVASPKSDQTRVM